MPFEGSSKQGLDLAVGEAGRGQLFVEVRSRLLSTVSVAFDKRQSKLHSIIVEFPSLRLCRLIWLKTAENSFPEKIRTQSP